MTVLLLLRFTGRNRRPGPTSTLCTVAVANRTVAAPCFPGLQTDDSDEDTEPVMEVKLDSGRGTRQAWSAVGFLGSYSGSVVEKQGILRGGGFRPSGLATRRIDLGFGGGGKGSCWVGLGPC